MSQTDRITDLEEQLAHTTRQAEELSDVVADQAKRLEVLKRRVLMLMQRVAAEQADAGGGVVIGDQKPPHW